MRIAIIGNGNVGSALQRGLERGGHEVEAVGHEPERIREAARAAEAIILAVPFGAVEDVVKELDGAADDKVLVDVTNALDSESRLALGFTTSGAEELQKKAPAAKVVKAFNTVFATHMDDGHADGEQLSAMIASDDDNAKNTVMELARSIGFDPVDAGPLENARLLEPMAYQNIQLGYALGMGTDIGFKLVH
jgi:predicted dinucleotide-binding enzyme